MIISDNIKLKQKYQTKHKSKRKCFIFKNNEKIKFVYTKLNLKII